MYKDGNIIMLSDEDIKRRKDEIRIQLAELDIKGARAARALLLKIDTDKDYEILIKIENQAQQLREEYARL